MSNRPRIRLPETIRIGDIIEVKTLITHVMETGNRRDKDGVPIPRNIINLLVATFDGREVFRAELNSGISANPYIAFHLRVTGPGDLELTWMDDQGLSITERAPVNVS